MFLKNKKIKYSLGIFLLLLVLVASGLALQDHVNKSKLKERRNYLTNKVNEKDIYALGKNTVITNSEIEQTTKYCMMSGFSEEDAKTQAIAQIKEREALYQAAVQNGYSVTDEEVWEYLNKLKESINEAENKEDVMAIINQ